MLIAAKWPGKIESRNWWDGGRTPRARKWRWAKGQEEAENTRLSVLGLLKRRKMHPPIHATLTRIAPRKLDDDNLAGGFKHIRDGIARAVGVDDKPGSGLTFACAQERGRPGEYAFRVEIEEAE